MPSVGRPENQQPAMQTATSSAETGGPKVTGTHTPTLQSVGIGNWAKFSTLLHYGLGVAGSKQSSAMLSPISKE
ncbi:hypothetical protein O181_122073 [Austropuccinia psidii MF-1]|uniref:Uncharacterized protein n=1 Tax=Austropuccinia psidii MF-1 TaxID=1389203 RepID=A0A9Q3KIQ6_9BASI|nr:hypothetical protein [Austropuccinia psidii MF-1]